MPRHSNLPPAQQVELVLAVLRGTEKLEVRPADFRSAPTRCGAGATSSWPLAATG